MDIDTDAPARGTKRKREASPPAAASTHGGGGGGGGTAASGTGPGVFDPLEAKRKMLHPLLLRVGDGQSSSGEISKLVERLGGLLGAVAGKDEGAWRVVWRILYDCAITLPVKVPIYAALASSVRSSPGAQKFVDMVCDALQDYAVISVRGGDHPAVAVDLVGGDEYRARAVTKLKSDRLASCRIALLRRYRVLQARYRARQLLRLLAELSGAGAVAASESIAAMATVAGFAAEAAAAARGDTGAGTGAAKAGTDLCVIIVAVIAIARM